MIISHPSRRCPAMPLRGLCFSGGQTMSSHRLRIHPRGADTAIPAVFRVGIVNSVPASRWRIVSIAVSIWICGFIAQCARWTRRRPRRLFAPDIWKILYRIGLRTASSALCFYWGRGRFLPATDHHEVQKPSLWTLSRCSGFQRIWDVWRSR